MMRNAVLACAAGTLAVFAALAAMPAHAQYTNPYTGNTFNNPNSSLIDTTLLGMSRSMMLSNSLMSSSVSSRILAQHMKRGQQIIKSGKATTRYTPRNPFPLEFWLKRNRITNPAQRKQFADEVAIQKVLWDQEAKLRRANLGDMGDALALTFIMAWEAQTGGEKATQAQFKGTAEGYRKMLRRNAYFQAMTNADRQTYIEGQMLNASDSVRLLRDGQLQKAREGGKRVTDTWLQKGQTHFVANPAGFTGAK